MLQDELKKTIADIVVSGKGILAADESTKTIMKRFAAAGITCDEESRRQYRQMLFTTPKLAQSISAVILYEETLGQLTDDNQSIPTWLADQGIVPGIKVDMGTTSLPNSGNSVVTMGLDGLDKRLQTYKEQGARFAKWRAVLSLQGDHVDPLAVRVNGNALAHYAALCQAVGIVPIVEPELLMDGKHTIQTCQRATEFILREVFSALSLYGVWTEYIILKPNMVLPGCDCPQQATAQEVALLTLEVFKRVVPAAVPSINFLSGGQSDQLATEHLQVMNAMKQSLSCPWNISFSYGRALQSACLRAWKGQADNHIDAQSELLSRAVANAQACLAETVHDAVKIN